MNSKTFPRVKNLREIAKEFAVRSETVKIFIFFRLAIFIALRIFNNWTCGVGKANFVFIFGISCKSIFCRKYNVPIVLRAFYNFPEDSVVIGHSVFPFLKYSAWQCLYIKYRVAERKRQCLDIISIILPERPKVVTRERTGRRKSAEEEYTGINMVGSTY